MILPEGTAVLDDDLELRAATLRRYGDRLYVMGDVIVPEEGREVLEQLAYLHADGDILLPAALEEPFYAIPELEYGTLRLLKGKAIVGKPMLRLGKEMLQLYPEGIACVGCAMVTLDAALEPVTIAKKLTFEGCALVKCTALQENAVNAVSKDVAQIMAHDDVKKILDNDTVKLNGIQLTL